MKKIMIVEDIFNKELDDYIDAKDSILNSKSDLILLDINIPYLNGELLLNNIFM